MGYGLGPGVKGGFWTRKVLRGRYEEVQFYLFPSENTKTIASIISIILDFICSYSLVAMSDRKQESTSLKHVGVPNHRGRATQQRYVPATDEEKSLEKRVNLKLDLTVVLVLALGFIVSEPARTGSDYRF